MPKIALLTEEDDLQAENGSGVPDADLEGDAQHLRLPQHQREEQRQQHHCQRQREVLLREVLGERFHLACKQQKSNTVLQKDYSHRW